MKKVFLAARYTSRIPSRQSGPLGCPAVPVWDSWSLTAVRVAEVQRNTACFSGREECAVTLPRACDQTSSASLVSFFNAVFRSPVCCLKLSLHTSWTECFALCCSVLVSALSLNKTHSFRMKSCYFRMLSQFMEKK